MIGQTPFLFVFSVVFTTKGEVPSHLCRNKPPLVVRLHPLTLGDARGRCEAQLPLGTAPCVKALPQRKGCVPKIANVLQRPQGQSEFGRSFLSKSHFDYCKKGARFYKQAPFICSFDLIPNCLMRTDNIGSPLD